MFIAKILSTGTVVTLYFTIIALVFTYSNNILICRQNVYRSYTHTHARTYVRITQFIKTDFRWCIFRFSVEYNCKNPI